MIEKGQRRIFVITEGLTTLIIISILALFASPHAVGVLTVTGGAVGALLSLYFYADGKIKISQSGR
jgi:Tfp pilus assembly protein FimT